MAAPGSHDRDRDQDLLSRLNALKPTSIASIAPPAPSLEKQPVSREDALAERLRKLRNQTESDASNNSNSLISGKQRAGGLPPAATDTTLSSDLTCTTQPQLPAVSSRQKPTTAEQAPKTPARQRDINKPEYGIIDDDYLQYLQSGDDPGRALDELLEGLEEFDPNAGDEEDLDDHHHHHQQALSEFDPGGEAKKVSDLLERFQKHSAGSGARAGVPQPSTSSADGHAVSGKVSGDAPAEVGPRVRDRDDDDDDSEGEHMTRDVERILKQVRDEVAVPDDDIRQMIEEGKAGRSGFTPTPSSQQPGDEPDSFTDDSFKLPDAPASPLRDLLNDSDTSKEPAEESDRKSFDFENDMVARMASLKGLGSAINVDSFGLPVAPTFAPQERSSTASKKTKGIGRAGYTDEDQKTWCIVCLDDATIKCVGCDDDVYCARCWKDMHMGPSAGYDERGHRWVKFVR